MCFIFTIIFVALTITFITKALYLQAAASGIIALVALIYLVRKLYLNGDCIFRGKC